MKLSDIKGDEVMDMIADLIEPIAIIAEDKEASELFAKKPIPNGMDESAYVINRIRKSVPKLMKGHKKELIKILSIMNRCSVEEYESTMTLKKVIQDVGELLGDEEFIGLFI